MQNSENNNPLNRKKKNKKNFGYIYLFIFVFIIALVSLSYIIKSYSPDVDVAIGNNEALTLSESEMNMEIKPIDERLKWIQMEDEMPSVAKRDNENKQEEKTEITEDKPVERAESPPIPSIEDIKNQRPDFRNISPATPVIPLPERQAITTKVYLGSYSSLEEAIAIQNKVSNEEPELEPFIKAIRDTYIVQLGSFSDKEKANALVIKLKEKGYTPKIIVDNKEKERTL